MFVITKNTALDTKRSFISRPEEVESTYEGEDIVSSDTNLSLDINIGYAEGFKSMDKRLKTLKPEQRKCIIYSYFYGYTHQELSELMGKPLGTIKSWIKRGKNQLLVY